MNIYDVIKKPLITEKTTTEKDTKNVVAVVVNTDANKIQIKQAAEKLFKVEVKAVRTINMAGKVKRTGKNIGTAFNDQWYHCGNSRRIATGFVDYMI